jgi:uncharacterized protein YoxC
MAHAELALWLVFFAVLILGIGIIQELKEIAKQLREIGMELHHMKGHAETISHTLLNR